MVFMNVSFALVVLLVVPVTDETVINI